MSDDSSPAPDTIGEALRAVQAHFEGEDDPVFADLRDLVTRAAEEHNRRAPLSPAEEAEIIASAPGQIGPGLTPIGRADWTPERLREARERCERATPGPWEIDHEGLVRTASPEMLDEPIVLASTYPGEEGRLQWSTEDRAFIAHAREALPAALAWGEQQAREIEALRANLQSVLGSACRRAEELARERDSKAAEIERLTAELAARAPADASLEARAEALGKAISEAFGPVVAPPQFWRDTCIALVRAVDASRPTTERIFPRVTLSTVKPGSLIEIASGDLGIALAAHASVLHRPILWIATAHEDTMPATATVSLRATPAELDALTSADASRPGLTEEQAEDWAEDIWQEVDGEPCDDPAGIVASALLRASRGETGPAADPRATLHADDPASLADVVAASAREPHADVVLHALHVSGGAAAVASLDEKHVLVTSRVDGVTRTTVDGEHVPLRRAAGPKCNNCDDTGTCGACNAEPVDPPCVLCSLGDCLCGERRGNREP